jgi:hypothetical protein
VELLSPPTMTRTKADNEGLRLVVQRHVPPRGAPLIVEQRTIMRRTAPSHRIEAGGNGLDPLRAEPCRPLLTPFAIACEDCLSLLACEQPSFWRVADLFGENDKLLKIVKFDYRVNLGPDDCEAGLGLAIM